MGIPPLGEQDPGEAAEKEEIMGKDKGQSSSKGRGTCRFCGRHDLSRPAHGACGMCYGLIRSKDIDTKTGEMSAVALDRIDAARALAGLPPLNAPGPESGTYGADLSARQAFKSCGGWSGGNACGDPAPGGAAVPADAPLTFSAEPTAVSPEEREFLASGAGAAVETVGVDVQADGLRAEKAKADAAVHRARARLAEARWMSLRLARDDDGFLDLDGERLPLVRRSRGSEIPYLLITRALREMVLPQALAGMVPDEARSVLIYGQAGAGVLALLPIAHDDKDALPLRVKKDRGAGRTIYAGAVLRDLRLKPGRYPARVLPTGIIAVDLTSAA